MNDYRWNKARLAEGYDAAASRIHPYYDELQRQLLALLSHASDEEFLCVDLGGGSGRWAERFLNQYARARVMVVDQSEAFLDIARRRLDPFQGRGTCVMSRLQDDWRPALPGPARAIVSMSAIHHLEPREKQELYARCHDALAPGGVLLNADEVRPEEDAEYLAECRRWAAHMQQVIEKGALTEPMVAALAQWEQRNIGGFGSPRVSGDDCHETAAAQAAYLRQAGFLQADVPWTRGLWSILRGMR